MRTKKIKEKKEIMLIGICGRTSSGKSTVCEELAEKYSNILHLKADMFTKVKAPKKYKGFDNWECEESILADKLITTLFNLKKNTAVLIPSKRRTEIFDKKIYPKRIIIVDGFLIFKNKRLSKLFDKKIFIDISDINILYRKLKRKQDLSYIDYIMHVAIPYSKKHEMVQKSKADIIIDGNGPKEKTFEKTEKFLKKEGVFK